MTGAVIAAERLTVSRGGRRVLNDISFEIGRGEVYALLGGNGAGKSTALLTFLGLLKPDAGEARVMGRTATAEPERVREHLAYLPEAAALYGHLTAHENLTYFMSLARRQRTPAEFDAALDQVGLQPEARGRTLGSYSKGMRQKVAIALALLRRTPVLLLDEPTSGLDPLAIDEFNSLITRLCAEGVTTLMVTHDVYGACHVARRIGLLRDGRIMGAFDAQGGRIDPEAVHNAFAERVTT